jgi:hypothetical protein
MSDNKYKKMGGRGKRTRKHYSVASSMSREEYGCGTTIHGLQEWYRAMFEKLGWMIIAKHKKYHSKITAYKNAIKLLKTELEEKIEQVENHDKKTDLKIMHYNVCLLMEHVNKDFH